jgi:hypothetical protein
MTEQPREQFAYALRRRFRIGLRQKVGGRRLWAWGLHRGLWPVMARDPWSEGWYRAASGTSLFIGPLVISWHGRPETTADRLRNRTEQGR